MAFFLQVQQVPAPEPVVVQVSAWDAFIASLTGIVTLLVRGLLKFLGFLLIIFIGWIVSAWVGRLVATVLRKIRFNELAERTGLTNVTTRMGTQHDPAGLIGEIIKWLLRIVVIAIAFAALGLPALSGALNRFILWIPNLVIALVVLLIGGLAANALGNIVRGITSDAGFRNPNVLANVTRATVWIFAIVVAVNQVGIGDALVNTLMIAAVSSLALATGLAFGLGGRDLAAQALDRWSKQAQDSKERIQGSKSRTGTGRDS